MRCAETPSIGPGLLRTLSFEKLLLVCACRDRHVEETDHHFVVSLLTPSNRGGWVWVVKIAGRIVKMGHRLKLSSCLQSSWLGQPITHLPVEVVLHSKQRLQFNAGVCRTAPVPL